MEERHHIHCVPIWQCLESLSNTVSLASALDLKRMLSNLDKLDSQHMDDYLRLIKSIIDSLAAIKSPSFDLELIQYTPNGLGSYYNNFVDHVSFLPSGITFDEVHTHLLLHKRRVNYVRICEHCTLTHQAFVAITNGTILLSPTQLSRIKIHSKGQNNKGQNRGCKNNRNNKGHNNNNNNSSQNSNSSTQSASSSRSAPIGSIYYILVVLLSDFFVPLFLLLILRF